MGPILSEMRMRGVARDFGVRDALLVALTFSSGALDAISFLGLGRIFSAFMTGNLVFLGLGIAGVDGPALLPVIAAVAFFAAGAYAGTWIAPTPSSEDQNLWTGRVSAALALAAALLAAFLAVWIAAGAQPSAAVTSLLLALSSCAMGLQTAAVRALGVQGVFTTAATFTVLALAGDFAGSRSTAEAPRLAAVLVGLVAGAALGGVLFVHATAWAPLLPLGVTVLVIAGGHSLRSQRAATPASTHG